MACDFGARTVHHYEGGWVTIRDPTMEQKDTFNIVSRRGYLSRCDQRDQRRESTKKKQQSRPYGNGPGNARPTHLLFGIFPPGGT